MLHQRFGKSDNDIRDDICDTDITNVRNTIQQVALLNRNNMINMIVGYVFLRYFYGIGININGEHMPGPEKGSADGKNTAAGTDINDFLSEELMQLMDISNDSITAAQREKARKEMFGLMGQLHAAERTERDMLLHQAARNLGCKGSVAKELVETVKTIYDATQSWGGGGGRRHGGGGGRPPPPPPQR